MTDDVPAAVALIARIEALEAALADMTRILEAVRFSAGLGKNQITRLNLAKDLIQKGHPK